MTNKKQQLIQQLIQHTAELAQAGMTPATSSNFSARLDDRHCLITASGRDKGKLTPDDFMEVTMDGEAVDSTRKSSAETLLHTQIYRLRPDANAVLHTHSPAQTLMSMRFGKHGRIEFAGYELQKAFRGVASHEGTVALPIVANSQDMRSLCAGVLPLFERSEFWGYLIEGHGIYTWGRDIDEARRHLDAFEFLLNVELSKLGLPS
jgi:methylthioribulose-1-phosphate dehydratase